MKSKDCPYLKKYSLTESIEQMLEDFYQHPLLIGREAFQAFRWFGHPVEYGRTEASSGRSKFKHFDPPVAGRRLTPDKAARLEPIDKPCHIRRIASQCLSESGHRNRPVRLD